MYVVCITIISQQIKIRKELFRRVIRESLDFVLNLLRPYWLSNYIIIVGILYSTHCCLEHRILIKFIIRLASLTRRNYGSSTSEFDCATFIRGINKSESAISNVLLLLRVIVCRLFVGFSSSSSSSSSLSLDRFLAKEQTIKPCRQLITSPQKFYQRTITFTLSLWPDSFCDIFLVFDSFTPQRTDSICFHMANHTASLTNQLN